MSPGPSLHPAPIFGTEMVRALESLGNVDPETGRIFGNPTVNHLTRSGRVYHEPPQGKEDVSGSADKTKYDNPQPDDTLLQQLKRTQANISIWELMMASPIHRASIAALLSKAAVPIETTPENLTQMITTMAGVNSISFSDEDLPAMGPHHVNPLYITVEARKSRISKVLVDGGSALNVCPLKTAKNLGFLETDFEECKQKIRAYDNSARNIVGKIEMPVRFGPCIMDIPFVVLDIPASFTLLLGRPWLHDIKGVASTLHQKVRFELDGKIITILGDGSEVEVAKIGLDKDDPPVELSGYSMDDGVNTLERTSDRLFFSPFSSSRVARWMLGSGYVPKIELGCLVPGMSEFPKSQDNPGRYGLEVGKDRSDSAELKKFNEVQRMLRKAYKLPISMESLNGLFRKEGESEIFFGFKELANGELITGWDMIFKTEIAKSLHTVDDPFRSVEPEPTDWIVNVDDAALGAIFGPVCAVSDTEDAENDEGLIVPISDPLDNWTMTDAPVKPLTEQKGAEDTKEAADEEFYQFESVSESVLMMSQSCRPSRPLLVYLFFLSME